MLKIVFAIATGLVVLVASRLVMLARDSRKPWPSPERVPGTLAPCTSTLNCVASVLPPNGGADSSFIEPLRIAGTPEDRLRRLTEAVRTLGGVIRTQDGPYLHAEFTTRIMGYVDDFEAYLDPTADTVHIKSASRVGKSDLGANRARIEALRKALATQP